MNAMAPTRPTELYWHCVPLTKGPAAAAEARGQVRAAVCAWEVPIDASVDGDFPGTDGRPDLAAGFGRRRRSRRQRDAVPVQLGRTGRRHRVHRIP